MSTTKERLQVIFDDIGSGELKVSFAEIGESAGEADKKVGGFGDGLLSVGGIAKTIATGAMAALVKSHLDATEEVGRLSIRLGVSTEALSQYRYLAEQTDISFQTLSTGIQRMTRRVSEAAQGTGEAKDAIAALGVDIDRLSQLEPDQQFEVLAEALSRVPTQADRVRLAFKLFDTEGVRFLEFMNEGAAGIQEVRQEAAELGSTITNEMVAKAEQANASMKRMQVASGNLTQSLAIELAPGLAITAEWMAEKLPQAAQEGARGLLFLAAGISEISAKYYEWGASAEDFFESVIPGYEGFGDVYREQLNEIKDTQDNLFGAFDELGSKDINTDGLAGQMQTLQAQMTDSLQAITGEYQELPKATTAVKAEQRELAAIFEATRTPLETYTAQMERLAELYESGKLDETTFKRAGQQAKTDLDDANGTTEFNDNFGELQQRLLSETELENQRYQESLDMLEQAEAAKLESIFSYQELRERAAADHQGRLDKINEEGNDAMLEITQQAARNMQDAFADFLFDPFESGLDGLLDSFTKTLQRMVAEMLSQQILGSLGSALGNSGNPYAAAFGAVLSSSGGRASGGPVGSGSLYEINERGVPEVLSVGGKDYLMTGNSHGQVTAPQQAGGGGGSTAVTLVDNRDISQQMASSPGVEQVVMNIFERNKRKFQGQ